MTKKKLDEWTVLGRKIGRASGWDQGDTFQFALYDFQPNSGCGLPKADCLWLNFDSGRAEVFSDSGEVISSCDLVAAVMALPVVAP